MKRPLIFTAGFSRAAKRVLKRQPSLRLKLRETLALLEADAWDPQLHTHKLKGSLADLYACSIAYDLRIVFEFAQQGGGEAIGLLDIGTHDEVY